ncbi:SLATT domain-containing protein [Pseudomonas fulva]|uniref:SLATT domain-containing protein n=1 Tax=Pseudomonas fulva TaxID=47880 RepID=UPI0015F41ED1|nr:SLATT domain-containing protein [Pseudomonas fulva]MBA5708962.1 SLATT domain-containing protein [Pseudomonas fulva]
MKELDTHHKLAEINSIKVLGDWLDRCKNARDGHYKRAEALFYRSQTLGYILIYATVFVTVFSFFPIDTKSIIFWSITKQHILVLTGCISAVISGIVTQARYGERAEIHRSSGARYANLARSIELLELKVSSGVIDNNEITKQSVEIITEWNTLAKDSLLTPHNESKLKLTFHALIALLVSALFFIVASSTQAAT